MRRGQCGGIPLMQPPQHLRLRCAIQRRGDLVKQQHRRAAQQRPRDRNALPLSRRQALAVFAERRIESLRQLAQKTACSVVQRLPQSPVRSLRVCQQEIFPHGAGKQHRRLRHKAEKAPRRGSTGICPLIRLQQHAALLRAVRAEDQAVERALAAPRHARQARPAIQRHARAEIAQHRALLPCVGKGHMVKYERQRLCVLRHFLARRFVRQSIKLVEPVYRRVHGGKLALHARQPRHGGTEQADELQNSRQVAEAQASAVDRQRAPQNGSAAAKVQHQRKARPAADREPPQHRTRPEPQALARAEAPHTLAVRRHAARDLQMLQLLLQAGGELLRRPALRGMAAFEHAAEAQARQRRQHAADREHRRKRRPQHSQRDECRAQLDHLPEYLRQEAQIFSAGRPAVAHQAAVEVPAVVCVDMLAVLALQKLQQTAL